MRVRGDCGGDSKNLRGFGVYMARHREELIIHAFKLSLGQAPPKTLCEPVPIHRTLLVGTTNFIRVLVSFKIN